MSDLQLPINRPMTLWTARMQKNVHSKLLQNGVVMRSGDISDFVAVGDVGIKVIGADNQI